MLSLRKIGRYAAGVAGFGIGFLAVAGVAQFAGLPSIGSAPQGPATFVSGQCSSGPIATPAAVAADATWVANTLGNIIYSVGQGLHSDFASLLQGINNIQQGISQWQVYQASSIAAGQMTQRNAQQFSAPPQNSPSCVGMNGTQVIGGARAATKQAMGGAASAVASGAFITNVTKDVIPRTLSADPAAMAAAVHNMGGTTRDDSSWVKRTLSEKASTPSSFDAGALMNPGASASDPAAASKAAEAYINHTTNPNPPPGNPPSGTGEEADEYSAKVAIQQARMSLAQEAMRHVMNMTLPNPAIGSWAASVIRDACSSGGLTGETCSRDWSVASENDFYDVQINQLRAENNNWYASLYSEPEASVARDAAMLEALHASIDYKRMLLEEREVALLAA